ncbi:MAG: anion transporter [Myxococcota bacterium]
MNAFVITVFVAVYVGMLLGGVPGLRVDRTGVALIGAIVLLAGGGISEEGALDSLDVPTLALLFGLMVLSAQLELGGFYQKVASDVGQMEISPSALLCVVVVVTGLLSAILTNDVVCLAVAPLLANTCLRRGLDPVPFLLGLACAANVGSAATIIGNPQNILIGESLDLSFGSYLSRALPITLVNLALVWGIIAGLQRGRWHQEPRETKPDAVSFDRFQTAKGILVLGVLVVGFLFTDIPREMLAISGAAVLLLSRRFHSSRIVKLVDWPLIVLFVSLFVINAAFQDAGGTDALVSGLDDRGVRLESPGVMFIVTAVLSNLVSNVPAVMLMLPLAKGSDPGLVLALSSTLAGNLIVVGSVANIIVIAAAQQEGVSISPWAHARVGVPVTLATLAIAALFLFG